MKMMLCCNCAYFTVNKYKGGLCRRYPPVAFTVNERDSYDSLITYNIWAQPYVEDFDFCGEGKFLENNLTTREDSGKD